MISLKSVGEGLLARSGAARWALRRRHGQTLILAYHNVVPDGTDVAGERSLHLSRSDFARQLDVLSQSHDVVPLASCLDPPPRGNEKPQAVITFDDAYLGAVTTGLAEVADRGLPATVFVAPGILGNSTTWWDQAAAARGGRLEPVLREKALEQFRGDEGEVLTWLDGQPRSESAHSTPPKSDASPSKIARPDDLDRVDALPGVTLGAHGWSHVNLRQSEEPELRAELERPLRWLRSRFDSVIPWLSYPYGKSTPGVKRAAADAGYRGAVRVTGGWIEDVDESDPYGLPRINVPAGVSIDGFRLRISGILTS